MRIFALMKPEYSKYFKEPRLVLAKLLEYASPMFPDDKKFLRTLYRLKIGEQLDLEAPRSYTAKIQWIKLYWRNPILNRLIDKYEVKAEVAKLVGSDYVIPTLGVWDNTAEIDFDSLPDRFVLKCTHDCKSTVICKDKATFDYSGAVASLDKSLKKKYWLSKREWGYKDIRPRIIAEELIEDPASPEGLTDYKFLCFNGEVKALLVATGRGGRQLCLDFFDREFNHFPFHNEHHPHSATPIEKPSNYEEMVRLAETLSKGFPHVRIDLYSIGGKEIFFGEYTFYPASGMGEFKPREWDYTFGSWFELPEPYLNNL